MKAIVETKGQIMLVEPTSRDVIPEDRPAVVHWSNFLESRAGSGQIKVYKANLPDEASDADWAEFFAGDDKQETALLVDAYVAKFDVQEAPKKPSPRKKPAAQE